MLKQLFLRDTFSAIIHQQLQDVQSCSDRQSRASAHPGNQTALLFFLKGYSEDFILIAGRKQAAA